MMRWSTGCAARSSATSRIEPAADVTPAPAGGSYPQGRAGPKGAAAGLPSRGDRRPGEAPGRRPGIRTRTPAGASGRRAGDLSAVAAVSAVAFRSYTASADVRGCPRRFVSAVPQFPQCNCEGCRMLRRDRDRWRRPPGARSSWPARSCPQAAGPSWRIVGAGDSSGACALFNHGPQGGCMGQGLGRGRPAGRGSFLGYPGAGLFEPRCGASGSRADFVRPRVRMSVPAGSDAAGGMCEGAPEMPPIPTMCPLSMPPMPPDAGTLWRTPADRAPGLYL